MGQHPGMGMVLGRSPEVTQPVSGDPLCQGAHAALVYMHPQVADLVGLLQLGDPLQPPALCQQLFLRAPVSPCTERAATRA